MEGQSKYTAISKLIGHRLHEVALPPQHLADELLEKVRQADEAAFTEVFKIYRFAATPETVGEIGVLNTICEAYRIGEKIFREIYDENRV